MVPDVRWIIRTQGRFYGRHGSFIDPDGNGRLLQEIGRFLDEA